MLSSGGDDSPVVVCPSHHNDTHNEDHNAHKHKHTTTTTTTDLELEVLSPENDR
jgi:hypothetical protein